MHSHILQSITFNIIATIDIVKIYFIWFSVKGELGKLMQRH